MSKLFREYTHNGYATIDGRELKVTINFSAFPAEPDVGITAGGIEIEGVYCELTDIPTIIFFRLLGEKDTSIDVTNRVDMLEIQSQVEEYIQCIYEDRY